MSFSAYQCNAAEHAACDTVDFLEMLVAAVAVLSQVQQVHAVLLLCNRLPACQQHVVKWQRSMHALMYR
jgi:hypothetical protein